MLFLKATKKENVRRAGAEAARRPRSCRPVRFLSQVIRSQTHSMSPRSHDGNEIKMVGDLKMAETEAAWSLKGEHRLQEGEEEMESPATPQRSQNHNEDNHGKRSVLARVKDKAKRWRNSFGKKKNGSGEAAASSPLESSPREEGKDDRCPEFHGAPIYETVMGSPRGVGIPSPKPPCGFTAATQRIEKVPATVQKPGKQRPNASKNKQEEILGASMVAPAAAEANPGGNLTLTQSLTQMFTPAYNMVSNATQAIASKIHGPPEAAVAAAHDELGAKQACDKLPATAAAQVWHKGVSVKEFLVQKLQPGEDERALSQVITEAISPRKAGSAGADRADQQGTDVVEKLKGAVSSLLGKEELIGSPAREEASSHGMNARPTTVSSPANAILLNQSEPSIPISTNPYSDKSFM